MAVPDAEVAGTSHMVATDRWGNVATLTSTIEAPWGSGVTVDGMFLNNELTDFSVAPAADGVPAPNRVEGGKRPRSSMSPTLVYGPDGRVRLAIGAAGGPTIIMQVAKAIIGVVDWEQSAQAAIALPTMTMARDGIAVERGTALEGMVPALTAMGHRVTVREPGFKANAIERVGAALVEVLGTEGGSHATAGVAELVAGRDDDDRRVRLPGSLAGLAQRGVEGVPESVGVYGSGITVLAVSLLPRRAAEGLRTQLAASPDAVVDELGVRIAAGPLGLMVVDVPRGPDWLLAGTVAGLTLVWLVPLALALFGHGVAQVLGALAWLGSMLSFLPTLRRFRLSPAWALALPGIACFYMAATLGSAWDHHRGRGVVWKRRAYGAEA